MISTSTSGSGVWVYWVSTSDATSTSITDNTWFDWNRTYTCGGGSAATTTNCDRCTTGTWQVWVREYTPPQRTTEELEAERQRREKYEADRKAAEARAAELLMEHLDDEQKAAFKEYRKFHVIGSDGARYEIECTKRMHNVFQLDNQGERVQELCAYQTGETPLADNFLAQKLALETDAPAFRRVANKWDYKTRRPLAA